MIGHTWMVVRRSRTIPGGYRVVQHALTEEQARARAAAYKLPHEAMLGERLVELRVAALAASRASTEEER